MALIKGTAGADILVGTSGNDTLQGNAGNDTLTGGSGNDLLQGGLGNNTYVFGFGSGTDTIARLADGTAGKFSILVLDSSVSVSDQNFQRVGNDLVLSYGSSDVVTVQDFFTPGTSPVQKIKSLANGDSWDLNRLLGTANGLRIEADGSTDARLTGGNYNDTLTGSYGNDIVNGGSGNDSLDGSFGDDTVNGGSGNDTLDGSYGNDTINGGSGNDTLDGGFGDDSIIGGLGDDELSDTFGNDTLVGGAGNDTISVSFGTKLIDGGANDDVIFNYARFDDDSGSTILFGKGDGNDTIEATAGKGVLRFKSGLSATDVIARRDQDDLLLQVGSSDNVTVRSFFKADGLGGFEGSVQTLTFADSKTSWDAAALLARIASNTKTLNGTNGNDILRGGATDDLISGGNGNDSLVGGVGYDTLVGGAGNDTMVGGTGNDSYFIDSAADVIVENAREGNDTVVLNGMGFTLNTAKLANVENITATTQTASSYSGNLLDNRIAVSGIGATRLSGLAGNDTLQGGAGNDTLDGGTGNNVYVFGKGSGQDLIVASTDASATKFNAVEFGPDVYPRDIAFSQVGNDLKVSLIDSGDTLTVQSFFLGNDPAGASNPVQAFRFGTSTPFTAKYVQDIVLQGNDTIAGTAQADRLLGGLGNDSLSGLAGNDTLDGGSGNDTLNGGLGNNVYLYGKDAFGLKGGRDVIEAVQDTSTTRLNTLKFNAGIDVTDVKFRQRGDDLVVAMSANDSVTIKSFFANGGPGNTSNPVQQFAFTDGSVTLTAAQVAKLALPANPAIFGTTGDDSLNGDYDDDNISGGDGNDLINGGGGNDTLSGGRGNDTLQAGSLLVGGEGDDTYIFSNLSPVRIVELADQGVDTITVGLSDATIGTSYSLDTPELAHIENLFGGGLGASSSGFITLTGNAADNVIGAVGTLGQATLYGLDGNDTLSGFFIGPSTMVGGRGDDTYLVSYRDNSGTITEQADEGIDTIDMGRFFNDHYTLDSASGNNVENLVLNSDVGSGSYAFNGNALDNTFTVSYARGNAFDGKGGADAYRLGGGSGTFVFDDAGDHAQVTDATNGFVIQSSVSVDLREQGNVFQATLTGSGDTTLTGGGAAEVLTGNAGNNQLQGGAGNDTLVGGLGSDAYTYQSGDGDDFITDVGGTSDALVLLGDALGDVRYAQVGQDLKLTFTGSSDTITVNNWFADGANQIEQIRTNAGVISNQQVNALVQAMVASGAPASAGTFAPTLAQPTVLTI